MRAGTTKQFEVDDENCGYTHFLHMGKQMSIVLSIIKTCVNGVERRWRTAPSCPERMLDFTTKPMQRLVDDGMGQEATCTVSSCAGCSLGREHTKTCSPI